MKIIMGFIFSILASSSALGQAASDLQALSEGNTQLRFRSNNNVEAFDISMHNDGILRFIANGIGPNELVAMQIDDETGYIGIGVSPLGFTRRLFVVNANDPGTAIRGSGTTAGVEGFSQTGNAILGTSNFGVAIRGSSGNFGNAVEGSSSSGHAIHGFSTSSYGVWGQSGSKAGGYFKGANGIALELAGGNSIYGGGDDDAVIRSQADQPNGDLIVVSNDAIHFHLDDDNNNNMNPSEMRVLNGVNAIVFSLTESGNLTLAGSCNCSSDVNRKEEIIPIDVDEILAKVTALPIKEWQFKGENIRHIGPMAQDFYAAFGLGQGETTIATVDTDGVALAAIQALKNELDDLKEEVTELKGLLRIKIAGCRIR